METDEVSERYITPCFVNGLEAYDGEINFAFDENLISNEYAVKLCLDCEVKKGQKSFMRLAKGIVDFGNGLITIYLRPDPFEDDSEKTKKSPDDWDQLLDFNFDDIPKLGEELPSLVCKMEKSNHNKRRSMENMSSFYQDIGPSLSDSDHLTQEETAKEALAIRISQKFALLEEVRPVIETMAYHDKYKKFSMRSGKTRGITMINHTQTKAMGILSTVLCQVGITTIIIKFIILYIPIDRDVPIMVGRGFMYTIGSTLNTPEKLSSILDGICHQTFRAARFDILRNTESDSDDEEEYQVKRNKFRAPIYRPKPAPYLKCNDPTDRSLALQAITNPFWKISVWKKATMGTHNDKARSSRSKRSRQHETVEEKYCFYKFTMNFCYGKVDVQNRMRCNRETNDMLMIRLREVRSDEEIFTSVAWIRAFSINEPIYTELRHKFYLTYEFDEVCTDDKLQTKKIIRFRLGGRAHSLTLLEFARRSHASTIKYLVLRVIHKMITYGSWIDFESRLIHEDPQPGVPRVGIPRPSRASIHDLHDRMGRMEIRQETIERMEYRQSYHWDKYRGVFKHMAGVYSVPLQGAYNPPCYAQPQNQNGYANVAWLIARWMKRKGAGSWIDSESRLIHEDPQPGVPRVGILRPSRASMHDLHDRMGRMEIRQKTIERMEYRQSYHWDRYRGVFKHMAGVYSVPLQGAYNPPGYAQPQYDQYYQQYPPSPPQYQQQQPDDDE
nr:hypothetical protein [Tanacetum cinerariifolium]